MYKILLTTVSLALIGCTQYDIPVIPIVQPNDNKLSCSEIRNEMLTVAQAMSTLDAKTGRYMSQMFYSDMTLLINQFNAQDARTAYNSRLALLANLQKKKSC